VSVLMENDMSTFCRMTSTELISVLLAARVAKTISSVMVMTAVAAMVSHALREKLFTP